MNHIEKACNKLPSPGIIFLFLFALTAVLSLILGLAGVAVKHPASGEVLQVRSFFSRDGLYWFLEHMISNFTSFAPLGLVLVMTAAVGFCEESGLIENLLRSKQLFAWTRIDTLLAVGGADFLKSTGFTGFGMIAVFILLSGFINILFLPPPPNGLFWRRCHYAVCLDPVFGAVDAAGTACRAGHYSTASG